MSEIARLKSEIQARKFRAMELSTEIDRRVREVRNLLAAFPLAKIRELQLALVSRLADEAADMQGEYLKLLEEIEQGEKELE